MKSSGSRFITKALSQYEGEKRLDKMSERVAEGDISKQIATFKKERPDPVTEYMCDVCKTPKRSFKLVRTHLKGMGFRVKNLRGWYIRACEPCANAIEAPVAAARRASGEPA